MDWELRDAVSCPPKESDDKRCFQMRWEGVTCGTWGGVEIIILYHCCPCPVLAFCFFLVPAIHNYKQSLLLVLTSI